MAKAYYSTVFDEPPDEIWDVIRDFNSYPRWVDGIAESVIEDGKAGDAIGAVRRFSYGGAETRQKLLALSDADRSFSFELCEPSPFPLSNFVSTLKVTPVVDGGGSFIEWWATFDCPPEEYGYWTETFPRQDGFANWLASLRRRLQASAAASDTKGPATEAAGERRES